MANVLMAISRVVLFAGVISLAGCDSGDPIDGPEPAEVAGLYLFEELVFVPVGQGIQSANVLDSLRQEATVLRLSTSGVFFLDFEFKQGAPYFVRGTYEPTVRTVTFTGAPADRAEYRRLLLEEKFVLRRDDSDPRLLAAEIDKRVNLEAFSPGRYAGVTDVPGTLRIRLVRQ
jgi:hypothetical protein